MTFTLSFEKGKKKKKKEANLFIGWTHSARECTN